MNQLGYYRMVWAGGDVVTAIRPYYGQRTTWLPLVQRWVLQILVPAFGDMLWINVDQRDLVETTH